MKKKTILNLYCYIFKWCGSFCHQVSERSFHIKNYQFPLCARCTGVIIGEFLIILFLIIGIKPCTIFSIVCLLIMFVDWFIQYINILESTNIRRLITGILGGLGIISLYFNIITFIVKLLFNLG